MLARSMLVVCKGLEKHATIARVKVETLNLYAKLLSTGKMITKESFSYEYDFCYCKVILSPLVSFLLYICCQHAWKQNSS